MSNSNLPEHLAHSLAEILIGTAIGQQDLSFVAALGLKPTIDGDKWCILWGEDLQSGVCGFGDTPILAIRNFNGAMHTQKIQP